MARRGRGRGRRGLEPEVATKPAPQPIKVPAPSPVPEIDLYTMPPQELPQAVIAPPKGQPIQIPVGVAPVVAPVIISFLSNLPYVVCSCKTLSSPSTTALLLSTLVPSNNKLFD